MKAFARPHSKNAVEIAMNFSHYMHVRMGLYFLWSIGYQTLIQSDFHK